MVWPVRVCQSRKVSISSGAEPEMNSRMCAQASRVSPASCSSRTYSVGTPMKTVARGRRSTTAFGSNFASHSIFEPFSSAPWLATNRPWTWKIGSAWISTSPSRQSQKSFSTCAFDSRLPWLSIAPLLRPVVPEV